MSLAFGIHAIGFREIAKRKMKTNFEKVTEKLKEVGAVLIDATTVGDAESGGDFDSTMSVQFWQVNQKGLIVCGYEQGGCGLYSFVGEEGAPVEKDLEFIEAYAAEPAQEFNDENN